jgi:hypothetical protein
MSYSVAEKIGVAVLTMFAGLCVKPGMNSTSSRHFKKDGNIIEVEIVSHTLISVGGGIQPHCDNVLTPPSRRLLLAHSSRMAR